MPAVPFKVKAVFEYSSAEPDDLNFPNGQLITVTDDEDADWYTGEYTAAAGDKREGLFPRNFVEKYEPAIPSRPARTPRKVTAPEPAPEPSATQEEPAPSHPPEPVKEAEIEPLQQPAIPGAYEEEPVASSSPPAAPQPAAAVPAVVKPTPPRSTNTAPKPGPPPVAEKPSTNSFRDRIAAFNKPAAAPIAPFKPGGQSTASAFIKKPFVAPPPSKHSYVPPPREAPPRKIYRREEDPSLQHEEEREAREPPSLGEEPSEDQLKPTSLKERIALLQKQQLEQAQRHAESSQKKEKPKKPPKKRVEPADEAEPVAQEEDSERLETKETGANEPTEAVDEATEEAKSLPARQASLHMPTPLPPRELVSDTNDADDSGAGDTEDAQGTSTEEDRPRSKGNTVVGNLQSIAPKEGPTAASDEEGDEDETEEEEVEDPEVRRKRELRERMAKMSGGMGMMGMFGAGAAPGAGAPRKARPSTEGARQSLEQQGQEEVTRAPPVPIMALPGMANQIPQKQAESAEAESEDGGTGLPTPHDLGNEEGATPDHFVSQPPKRTLTGRSTASMPGDRTVPPPPPREARAPPPPPRTEPRAVPLTPQSPTSRPMPPPPPPANMPEEPGEESEDEDGPQPTPRAEDTPNSPLAAPPLLPLKTRPEQATPPPLPRDPAQSPLSSPQTRAPPPPPPAQAPSRKSTNDSHGAIGPRPAADEDSEDEVTEYDGDYDTDIASSAKHKDALKSHGRDSSVDEGVLTDDAPKSPTSPLPARAVPPMPPVAAPRDVPPPPPSATSKSRKSTDAPRIPPPVPPPTQSSHIENDYDPYRYSAPQHAAPSPSIPGYAPMLSSPKEEIEEDDMYGAATQSPRVPPPPLTQRAAPPPPPPVSSVPEIPKQSLDAKRSTNMPRRSMEQQRPSGEHGTIASDLDLGRSTFWWTQENLPPPVLQQRNDVLFEMESSTSSKRGGKTMVSKDIYILYQDYSQTTVNAAFDASDPSHVTLEQTHERPPPAPRKDQLENASEQYGARIASAASSAASSNSTIGDGSAHGLILGLLRPLESALKPIGTRAYGALVYANLANASTQQFDEIRPGDIITFRNAKFSGHKGNLHSKYSVDVGKPDHVAVVIDWDGTKKKIRAWEQVSREEKGKKAKVKEESFKMSDLKSGEVRVWRVMGRTWVGWTKS